MEDFSVAWTMVINIPGKFMYMQCFYVLAFMSRDIISFNGIFSIFSLTGLIKLMVYLKICQWILKQLFHLTEILFFILIPRYCCYYVSRSVELQLCPWAITIVHWVVEYLRRTFEVWILNCLLDTFAKIPNGLLTLSQKTWMLYPCNNDLREISTDNIF